MWTAIFTPQPPFPSSRLISSVSFLQTPWCIFASLKLFEISCTNELSLFSLGQALCVHRGHSFTLPSGRPVVSSSPRGVLFEIPSLHSESRAPLWFINHQSSSGDLVLSQLLKTDQVWISLQLDRTNHAHLGITRFLNLGWEMNEGAKQTWTQEDQGINEGFLLCISKAAGSARACMSSLSLRPVVDSVVGAAPALLQNFFPILTC